MSSDLRKRRAGVRGEVLLEHGSDLRGCRAAAAPPTTWVVAQSVAAPGEASPRQVSPSAVNDLERFGRMTGQGEGSRMVGPLTPAGVNAVDEFAEMMRVAEQVVAERQAQDARWGEQNHPDGTGLHHYAQWAAEDAKIDCEAARMAGRMTWRHILAEEVAEAFAECDEEKLIAELVQVSAVAQAWIESVRRRQSRRLSHVAGDEDGR